MLIGYPGEGTPDQVPLNFPAGGTLYGSVPVNRERGVRAPLNGRRSLCRWTARGREVLNVHLVLGC